MIPASARADRVALAWRGDGVLIVQAPKPALAEETMSVLLRLSAAS